MYDDGFGDITNIDFSKARRRGAAAAAAAVAGAALAARALTRCAAARAPQVCISDMMRMHLRARPKMRWLVMDATAMKARRAACVIALPACSLLSRSPPQFGDGAFDTVVDKGALDALMGEPGAEGAAAGGALLAESARVAASAGGAVAVVSLLQDHVLEALLRTFRAGWQLSIRQVPPAPDMMTSPLQPFLVLARSALPAPSGTPPQGDDDAELPLPGALAATPVVLHGASGSGAGRVINAEQLRDVALLVARENAARAAGTAAGVRARAQRGSAAARQRCRGLLRALI